MRKMKDSGIEWIGEIPITWELRRLRFLCDIQTGNMDTQNNSPDGKYPFYVRSPKIEHSDSYTFDNEAVLMAGDGVGAGKVFHYVSGKYGCHQRVYSMSDFAEVNGKYLYYYLSENFYKKIEESNAKSTVDSVRLPMLKDFVVTFPKKDEQEKIVTYLNEKSSKIDAIIEKQQAVIGKLKEYKLSIITEAVTKGLNPNAEMFDSDIEWIGNIPVHWKSIKLKYCTYIRARLGWKGLKADEYVEKGFPLLSAFNIVNSKLDFENNINYINEFRYDESPEIKLSINDILLVKDGAGIGKCAIVEQLPLPSTTNGSLAVISTDDKLSAKFLYYFFLSNVFQKYIDRIKDGMGVPHLFQSDLREIAVVVPSIEEQNLIVEKLNEITERLDTSIQKKEKIIEKLVEYKKSLIYEVVTGKKEV